MRARELHIPLEGIPGALNAITDVAGVEVGYKTVIRGESRIQLPPMPLPGPA